MNVETTITIILGILDMLQRLLDIMERYQGEISEETQRKVQERIESIRNGTFFQRTYWKPQKPQDRS